MQEDSSGRTYWPHKWSQALPEWEWLNSPARERNSSWVVSGARPCPRCGPARTLTGAPRQTAMTSAIKLWQQWMDHNNSKFNLYNWRFLWQKDIAFKLVLKTKVMASQHIWLTNVYDQILRKFDTTIFSGSHQLQKTYSFPFSGSGGINSVNCFRILLEHIFNQTLSRFHNI